MRSRPLTARTLRKRESGNTCGTLITLAASPRCIPSYYSPSWQDITDSWCNSLWRGEKNELLVETRAALGLSVADPTGQSETTKNGAHCSLRPSHLQTDSADTQKNILLNIYSNKNTQDHRWKCRTGVYISVIQKQSFRSPPITQSGSVRCQLRPDPTAADPIITGCNDIGIWYETGAEGEHLKKKKIWSLKSVSLTCGWPRWWMSNWLQIFPGHPVVAKRFSLARDHLRRRSL